jgi:hypothetical protein
MSQFLPQLHLMKTRRSRARMTVGAAQSFDFSWQARCR